MGQHFSKILSILLYSLFHDAFFLVCTHRNSASKGDLILRIFDGIMQNFTLIQWMNKHCNMTSLKEQISFIRQSTYLILYLIEENSTLEADKQSKMVLCTKISAWNSVKWKTGKLPATFFPKTEKVIWTIQVNQYILENSQK